MRIGILSLNPGHNYGGILQSFALQTVLEGMGHEVSIICKNIYIKEPDIFHSYKYISRIIRMWRNRSSWKETVLPERVENQRIFLYLRNTERFVKKYLHCYIVDSFSDIKESDFDCIIVGSDQVWRPVCFENQYFQSIENAYLSFTEGWGIKRIAYAASFGTDIWEYSLKQTDLCANFLKAFDLVSVREDSGIELCRKHFSVTAQKTIDPTLLLSVEDYINKIDISKTPKSKGNLLVYVLDHNKELDKLVEMISKDKCLTSFKIGKQDDLLNPQEKVLMSVERWLRGFLDAEYVITDSFHACVFSLIFHKPFVVIGNKDRGMTRFESFLQLFALEGRMIKIADEYKNMPNIDFTYADNILSEQKKHSWRFLNSI